MSVRTISFGRFLSKINITFEYSYKQSAGTDVSRVYAKLLAVRDFTASVVPQ